MRWNSKKSTYYSKGRKAFRFDDELPDDVITGMGQVTLSEYIEKGLISTKKKEGLADPEPPKTADGGEQKRLFQTAVDCGLKPHYRTGISKLRTMIDYHKALQTLKTEALGLGIDPSDDVTFEELSALVDEAKKAVDETRTGDEFDH